ncbi:MAG: hypothetical protein AAF267_21720 [Deinococcota bacterium]
MKQPRLSLLQKLLLIAFIPLYLINSYTGNIKMLGYLANFYLIFGLVKVIELAVYWIAFMMGHHRQNNGVSSDVL